MACTIFPRNLGPIFIDVVVSESAVASMEIPTHPVERGAKISDHAWRVPTTLKMLNICEDMGVWGELNALMAHAEPFDVVTGFDLFPNMMIESIEPERDAIWADVLYHTVNLKEVIIVGTAEGPALGNAGTGGDERGLGMVGRGLVQAREVGSAAGGIGGLASLIPGGPIGTLSELTVVNAPFQRLDTYLADQAVGIGLNFNETAARWAMDIDVAGSRMVSGMRLTPGQDLLAQYELGIGRMFLIDQAHNGLPDRDALPSGALRLIHDDGLPLS